MVQYLSSEWLALAADAVAHNLDVQRLGDTALVIEVAVDDVRYALRSGDGSVALIPGPAAIADLRIVQSRSAAVAIAIGAANAQESFIRGDVRFDGPAQCLANARPLLEAIGAALSPLRPQTVY